MDLYQFMIFWIWQL